MARKTNNELAQMPGFFYYPSETEGLEELTFEQRCELLINQGSYMVVMWQSDPKLHTDITCMADNSRIPTHRRPGVEIPKQGAVPFDLREIIAI